jgi:hypothetical protein
LQILKGKMLRASGCNVAASIPVVGDDNRVSQEKHQWQQREHVDPNPAPRQQCLL